jgi:putative transposase
VSKAGERSREGEVAKTTIGLYKTECVRDGSPFRAGPLATLADLEDATSAWVHWHNTARLMHRLGRRPPAEAEAAYWNAPATVTTTDGRQP